MTDPQRSKLSLYYHPPSYITCRPDLLSIAKQRNEQQKVIAKERQPNPIYPFMYALKSSDARRQYHKRLKMLFDYLNLPNSLEAQATEFLNKARRNDGTQWVQHSLMSFLDFHKQRVRRKELAVGTLKNYYRAAKLFFQSNIKSRTMPRTLNYIIFTFTLMQLP
jgi:hypothetical protein